MSGRGRCASPCTSNATLREPGAPGFFWLECSEREALCACMHVKIVCMHALNGLCCCFVPASSSWAPGINSGWGGGWKTGGGPTFSGRSSRQAASSSSSSAQQQSQGSRSLALDVVTTEDAYLIYADIPGELHICLCCTAAALLAEPAAVACMLCHEQRLPLCVCMQAVTAASSSPGADKTSLHLLHLLCPCSLPPCRCEQV